MFASTESRVEASNAANVQMKFGSSCVALRVRLQRLLDTANKLPLITSKLSQPSPRTEISEHLKITCVELSGLLESQAPVERRASKRHRASNAEELWTEIMRPQIILRPKWEEVVNKFHARANYGSEAKKSKLKMFNQTIFDQISAAMSDEDRMLEKSRMPFSESPRLDKHDYEDEQTISALDEEVYDDRIFYSQLVKTFVSSMTNDGMKEDDLKLLRKFKKTKDVDRKASKGRKVRYTAHPKLQNFMYPVQAPAPKIDVDRLYQSLFQ